MSTVISLCDLTGAFVKPWVEAGHDAVLVDPQHGMSSTERVGTAHVTRLAMTIEEALPSLARILAEEHVAFVAGWPPCTDMAVSGARWFAGGFVMPKPQTDPTLGEPDNRIHAAPPSEERANFRSATPMGFARAVFAANHRAEVAA